MIRILFLAANPLNTDQLRLDVEAREISAGLEKSLHGGAFELKTAWAVRASDLLTLMNRYRPNILHFSGHGSATGEIVLESDQGDGQPVPTEGLCSLFSTFRADLQIVVLNACYSQLQAVQFADIVDVVVGMGDSVGDAAAQRFAASFYEALGFGQSVGSAYEQGVAALQLLSLGWVEVPEIIAKGVDIDTFHLAGPEENATAARLLELSSVSERIKSLLRGGSRALFPTGVGTVDQRSMLCFELGLRHADTKYVVVADSSRQVYDVAARLAEMLMSAESVFDYDWTLELGGQQVADHLTLEMASIKSNSTVLLVGNHRMPTWAPSPAS